MQTQSPSTSTSTSTSTPTDPTRLGAVDLARRIASGDLRATDVVEAHIARVQQVNPALNAVVVERFDEARREAKEADRRARAGGALGPLHGVPVTIKECLDLAGTASTFGLDGRSAKVALDADPVRRMREAGAIVLAKSNVAQHLLYFETDNPVFGRTNHPSSKERSPGGSSGGEAALIASHASPLGLGTDLGGSVRNPATSCGIVGFKPTAGRLVDRGTGSQHVGQELIASQVGAMARTVDDAALGLRVAMGDGDDGRGPLASHLDVDVRALRVVVMEDDGIFSPCPAARRAVREARDALVARGARVVDVALPDRQRAHDVMFSVMSAEGGAHMAAVVKGGRVDPRIQQLIDATHKPRAIVGLLLRMTNRRRALHVVSQFSDGSAMTYFRLVEEVRAMRRDALEAMTGADIVLTPACPLPAVRHGATLELSTMGSYTTYWNVMGWPAGVLPWTHVRAGEESERAITTDVRDVTARETERDSTGLPIGVQIAAAPHRDHVALAAMRVLEQRAA